MRASWILTLACSLALPSALAAQMEEAESLKRCADSDPEIRIAGCTALIRLGRESDEVLAVAFYNRALAYSGRKDYDLAFQDYDQAIRLNPGYSHAFNNRGNAYFARRDYERAMQDYDQAIRLDPDNFDAFNNRGLARLALRDLENAIQDFGQAILLYPDDAEAFHNRARAYSGQQDYNRALQDYDRALTLDPGRGGWLRQRGAIHFSLGHFALAEADFARALTLSPMESYDALWLYLARAHAGKDAATLLGAEAKQLDLQGWPGPVAMLYLGEITPAQLLEAARSADFETDRVQGCEAHFFLAEHALLNARNAEAASLFRKTVESCEPGLYRFAASKIDVARLGTLATSVGK